MVLGEGIMVKKYSLEENIKNRLTDEKFSSGKVRITPTKIPFQFTLVIVLRAPKTVSRPVDYIEEKVPILKDEIPNYSKLMPKCC